MRRGLGALFALLAAAPLGAQTEPAPAPRLALAGEVSGAFAPADRAFFNYTDHEYTALRLGRLSVSAALRVTPRVSVLAEARSDNLEAPRLHGLYARVRPFAGRDLDVQAGLVPPVFGAYPRRLYASDNFLVGSPLAYQYLTSLRHDSLPATVNDLVRMRGRGWRPSFPVGSQEIGPGLPLVSTLRWDAGVQARVGIGPIEALGAVTQGTLSSPRVRDDNGGKQLSGRLVARPVVGLVLGVSGARGAYVDEDAMEGFGIDVAALRQRAWGLDVEYSRDYWLVRAEGVWSAWDVPPLDMAASPLRAWAFSAEARYKLLPGLYTGMRFDRIGFSRLAGSTLPWDAPVVRMEAGGGYQINRHLLLKGVYQHNRREDARQSTLGVVAGQLLYWF
jgi:hypothetical protein